MSGPDQQPPATADDQPDHQPHEAREVPGLGVVRPLAGGWSGRVFAADLAGETSVVRVHDPDDVQGPATTAAALRLAAGAGVPGVPDVLEVRAGDPAVGAPGLLVTRMLPGRRGDLVLPTLDDAALDAVSEQLVEVLEQLAGVRMLRAGVFLDADLTVGPLPAPFDDGLLAQLEAQLAPQAARLGLDGRTLDRLRARCREAQDVLDDEPDAPHGPGVRGACLVHSDLNPKNLLLDGDRLTGVLDWEFAHAGSRWTDVGNLLRFAEQPAYVDGLVDRLARRRGSDPADVRHLARCADLTALVDLASRAGSEQEI